MSHISKIHLNKKSEQEILDTFNLVAANIHKEDEMKAFLDSMLSPTENLMLAKRLAIVLLLSENIPLSTISSTLHVTRETVVRIELIYKLKPEGYKMALRKISNQKRIKDLKNLLLKLAADISYSKGLQAQ